MLNKYADQAYMVEVRRHLHQYPELCYDLPITTSIVKEELDKMGIAYTEKYCPCSVVGVINPEKSHFTIGIRADMDGLPIQEKTGLPFSSKIDGQMHACGHDAHTACVLGVAKVLQEMRDKLDCRVLLIFQPNEEGPGSTPAKMIENGILEDGLDAILGVHIKNTLGTNTLGFCSGSGNASCRNFIVELFGKTAHAALPHTGSDTLAAAVQVWNNIQAIKTRKVDPKVPCVFSIGELSAGNAHNVVPDYAIMKGTIRTYDIEHVDAFLYAEVEKAVKTAAEMYDCTYKLSSHDVLPDLYNDPAMVELARKSAAKVAPPEKIVEKRPELTSEDFADFSKVRPSVYFYMGTGTEGCEVQTGQHCNDFVMNESAMEVAANFMVQFVLDNMNGMDLS